MPTRVPQRRLRGVVSLLGTITQRSAGSCFRKLGGLEQGFATGLYRSPDGAFETAMLGRAARDSASAFASLPCRHPAPQQRGFAARAAARPKKASHSEVAQSASDGTGPDKARNAAPVCRLCKTP